MSIIGLYVTPVIQTFFRCGRHQDRDRIMETYLHKYTWSRFRCSKLENTTEKYKTLQVKLYGAIQDQEEAVQALKT